MTHLAAIILHALLRDQEARPEDVAAAHGYTRNGAVTALAELRRAGLVQVRRVYTRSISVADERVCSEAMRDISRPRKAKYAAR
jgi:DNA-binding MarR family transcriptional regulator